MTSKTFSRIFPAWTCSWMLLSLLLAVTASAQSHPGAKPTAATIPAVLLSDIHFEPFADPGKVAQLAAAPVSEWKAILAAPPSANLQQSLASLQQACRTRGADTSFALYQSSLHAMQSRAVGAKFVTVSGDLISHSFSCKFNAVLPHAAPDAYKSFVGKTLSFVIQELNETFPGVPVYFALGNNDSDCGDYQIDPHSSFLADTGKEFTKNFPESERSAAQQNFATAGYYSVSLPAPMEDTRLLVLNDSFMSKKYTTCGGKADQAGADEQIAWLQQQLALARTNKEKIWVMGHIPPGIDLHGTVTKFIDVCSGQKPAMFLSSEKMADTLAEYGDVVELALFGHTHMDEMRLLRNESEATASKGGVPLKMVGSITPVDGNTPSFTVAQIDPATAALVDFRVFEASNKSGIDATWKEEYDFAHSYHAPAFDAATVGKLTAGFQADTSAKTEASQAYMRDFFVGDMSPILGLFWPQYACTLSNRSAAAYKACLCSDAK